MDYAAGRNNPNAIYKEGRQARARLEEARMRIARVVGAATDEIILTSWGTDANNLAIISTLDKTSPPLSDPVAKWHAITSLLEHSSVLNAFRQLEEMGVDVTYLVPNQVGLISAKQVGEALRPETRLVSIMYANNEIGTTMPIKEITRLLRRNLSVFAPSDVAYGKHGQSLQSRQVPPTLFHSDCVSAPGFLPINVRSLGVDMATFSAAKFGGPSGVGFIFRRRGVVLRGERDIAPVEMAMEMAGALEQAEKNRKKNVVRLTKLRDYLILNLLTSIPSLRLNGPTGEARLANNVNVTLPIDGELAVLELDKAGISASVGSACAFEEAGLAPRSLGGVGHVIMAIGRSKEVAQRSLRLSLGYPTSKSDCDYVVKKLNEIINKHTNLWQTK